MRGGEFFHSARCGHPFGHRRLAFKGLFHGLAGTKGKAKGIVARKMRCASQDQIAKSGQAPKACRIRAQGDPKAGDFRIAASNQSGPGAVAKFFAVNNTAGDGENVLDRSANLRRNNVV